MIVSSQARTRCRRGLWEVAMGTAGYVSPERVRGEKLDARTDLFSFGLVLYEMAAGRRALSGETASIVQGASLSASLRPGLARTAPAGLTHLLLRSCLVPLGKWLMKLLLGRLRGRAFVL